MKKINKKEVVKIKIDYKKRGRAIYAAQINGMIIVDFVINKILQYRFAISSDDYVTYVAIEDRWLTGRIDYTLRGSYENWSYYSSNDRTYFIDDSVKSVLELEDVDYKKVYVAVEGLQNKILDQRNKEKKLLKKMESENEQKIFEKKKIPDRFYEFAKTLFDKKIKIPFDRESNTVYCPYCDTTQKIDKTVKSNKSWTCPNCHRTGIARSKKQIVRGNYFEWSVVMQKSKDNILFRYFMHEAKQEKNGKVSFCTTERLRTKLNKETVEDYDYTDGYWQDYRSSRYNGLFGNGPGEWRYPINGGTLYRNINIESVEGFKYSMLKDFIGKERRLENIFLAERYLKFYKSHPNIEVLLKLGLKKLARYYENTNSCYYTYSGYAKINTESMKIHEILCLSKPYFQMLIHYNENPTNEMLAKTQLLYNHFKNPVTYSIYKDFMDLNKKKYYPEDVLTLMDDMTPHKIRKYVEEKAAGDFRSYCDYIKWIHSIGYKKTNEALFSIKSEKKMDAALYPKNFQNAHDRIHEEYNLMLDLKERKKKRTAGKKIAMLWEEKNEQPVYHYENDKYCILIPHGISDLQKESKALQHCVKTYWEKLALEKTQVYFIRQKKHANVPFYTLELKNDGTILQCRTLKNKEAAGDVLEFAKSFSKTLQKNFEKHPTQMPKYGYKAVSCNLTSIHGDRKNPLHFKLGKPVHIDSKLIPGNSGIHFCRTFEDAVMTIKPTDQIRYFRVKVGDHVKQSETTKSHFVTDTITLLEEVKLTLPEEKAI